LRKPSMVARKKGAKGSRGGPTRRDATEHIKKVPYVGHARVGMKKTQNR